MRGLVSDRDPPLTGETVTGGDEPPRPLLRIEFTSATNLARFAAENSWPLGAAAFPCGRRETFSHLAFPNVLWHSI